MTPAPVARAASRRTALYRIREARQIETLGSTARQEVVDALAVSGPASIAELASDLGRAPDSLYYHVRHLERVGLVVQRGERGAGPRKEALYDVPGARVVIDWEPATPRERKSLVSLVASALRSAERELRAALDSGRAVYRRCARRNAWGARVKGWLDNDELAEVREHLEAVTEIVARGRKRRGTGLHAVTYVLAPLEPSKRLGTAARKSQPRRKR